MVDQPSTSAKPNDDGTFLQLLLQLLLLLFKKEEEPDNITVCCNVSV